VARAKESRGDSSSVSKAARVFFLRSEIGRIKGWYSTGDPESNGGVACEGMGGAVVRMSVIDGDLGGRVGGSRISNV
jgi:hypothetical protein